MPSPEMYMIEFAHAHVVDVLFAAFFLTTLALSLVQRSPAYGMIDG